MNEVLIEDRDAVRWITLNRPEASNAMNDAMLAGMTAALAEAAATPALRAVVLTGSGGKTFCAGADLKEAAASQGRPFAAGVGGADHPLVTFFKAVEDCNIPIIGRINGHAMGGGLGFLCACDLAVAAEHARIGTPEVRVGVFPMMIMSHMLRLIPRRKLMELALTGEPWSAALALEAGLVNYVVSPDELDAKVAWLLERILRGSPTAVRMGKQAVHAVQDMALGEAFEYLQLAIARLSATADAREGFAAFSEKRPPRWPSAGEPPPHG